MSPIQPVVERVKPFLNSTLASSNLKRYTTDPLINSVTWLADGFRRDWEAHQFAGEKLAQGGSVVYRLLGLGLEKLGLKGAKNYMNRYAAAAEPEAKALIPWAFHTGEAVIAALSGASLLWAILPTVKGAGMIDSAKHAAEQAAKTALKTVA